MGDVEWRDQGDGAWLATGEGWQVTAAEHGVAALASVYVQADGVTLTAQTVEPMNSIEDAKEWSDHMLSRLLEVAHG